MSIPLNFSKEELQLTRLQDVAEQIRFLAMSSSITGVNTVIDAGFSL